jgi:hypothetical protein
MLLQLFTSISLAIPVPADTGQVLYARWCSSCHGLDGRGTSRASARLEVPAADLADCRVSSAEPDDLWIAIVRDGGEAYGLSIDMPAFGEGASEDQLREIVRYTKSLCGEAGWPPGELNLPRGFLTEKAFPENEVVIEASARDQQFIYERRIGRRLQVEGILRTITDGGDVFGGITAALKYNAWHSLARGALASLGLEVTPKLGRRTGWEIEPYVAAGLSPGAGIVVQGEALGVWEEGSGVSHVTLRGGVGRESGRFVPMLEAGWTIPRSGGAQALALYPQVFVQLSRLGHVAASIGMELPVAGMPGADPRLVGFVLWDFGDGALTRGW